MIDLEKAAPHVRLHRGRTFVLKVGGNALAKPAAIRSFAHQVAIVQALGARLVVVHGGGPQTDAIQRLLGEEPRLVDGRRVTTPTALRALRMATTGELAGDVVAALVAEGASAIGISAASSGVLVAQRRAPMRTSEGVVDLGLVGDIESVDTAPLLALLDQGHLPVLSPPAGDGQGGFLNVNADLTAAALAVALEADKLVLLTGAPGILGNPGDPASLLSALSLGELDSLEEVGALRGGMRVKAAAIRAALYGGVGRVHVVSGTDGEALVRELYTTHGAGTLVTREPERAPESSAGSASNGPEKVLEPQPPQPSAGKVPS
jgi:acetylglutamate kinase